MKRVGMLILLVAALSARARAAEEYTYPKVLKGLHSVRGVAEYTNFIQMLSLVPGGQEIRLTRKERADPAAPWFTATSVQSVSDVVMEATPWRGGDVLYVALIDAQGAMRIERWTYPVRNGRWEHQSPQTPSAAGYFGITAIKGGAFVPPNSGATPSPERVVIYRGKTLIHEVRFLAADPEGRFLLILDHAGGAGRVWQLDLTVANPNDPLLLHDASTIPDLGVMMMMRVYQHDTLGRVVSITNMRPFTTYPASSIALMVDGNNDGLFDQTINLTRAEHDANALYSGPHWTSIERAGTEQ